MTLHDIMSLSPVIAVVTVADAADAPALARALGAGGVRAIEITLRTPAGIEAIRRVAAEVPEVVVGAGTVVTTADMSAARQAGAAFLVSPGATPALLDAGRDAGGAPFLPGVATASELLAALERGYDRFKFFPAEAAGGRGLLKSLAGPFPDARFCPTGGITLENAAGWLALPNVVCVGGSWLTPEDSVAAKDWPAIEALARTGLAQLRP